MPSTLMRSPAHPVSGLRAPPEVVFAAWPPDHPMAVVWCSDGSPASRWTVFGEVRGRWVLTASGVWMASGEAPTPGPGLFEPLCAPAGRRLLGAPPFQGGWIGWIGYDAARLVEPEVLSGAAESDWPLAELAWCPAALVHDRVTGRWWQVGEPDPQGPIRRPDPARRAPAYRVGGFTSDTGEAGYMDRVERAVEYIRAGDTYQVNIAHRLRASFEGSSRAFFAAAAALARPWHGAYLESAPDDRGIARAVASLSPELFLSYDPRSRRLTTRPMKGTRPAGGCPRDLASHPKDRAELNMIVDLMRNDLGRVCGFGSVTVRRPRTIERHGGAGGLLQATATVAGTLREGLGLGHALCAAFPGGSVTGAPKIRAMQVIDELEVSPRGPYCGAAGFISRCGTARFNIAIRTALLRGRGSFGSMAAGTLDFSIGAGIVADSTPRAEWQETLDKAWMLRRLGSPLEAKLSNSDP